MKKINKLLLSLVLLGLAGCSSNEPAELHFHNYGDWQYQDEETHFKECTYCDESNKNHTITANHRKDNGEVIETSTHTKHGIKRYTCLDCHHTWDEELPLLEEHSYDCEIVSEEFIATQATCFESATYYKSCECGEKGTETFVYGSPLGHDITTLNIIKYANKMSYTSYEHFDPTGLEITCTCSRCDGGAITADELTFTYENDTDGFRSNQTKVIAHYHDQTFDISGITVSKTVNQFVDFNDTTIHCHEGIDLSKIKSLYGDVNITVKDKNNEELDPSEFTSLTVEDSPLKVTATVASTNDYDEISKTVTYTIKHDYSFIDGVNKCECGSESFENFYIDLSKNSVDYSDLTGPLAEDLKSIKLTVFDADTREELVVSKDTMIPGEVKECYINYSGDEIHFGALIVSQCFATTSELVAYAKSDKAYDGYYVLTNDLSKFVMGTGHSHQSPLSGTFDGRGHTIDGFDTWGYGLFGDTRTGSVIKDLTILNSKNAYMFGYSFRGDSLIENVKITIDQTNETLAKNSCGLLFNNMEGNLGTFRNVEIDFGKVTTQVFQGKTYNLAAICDKNLKAHTGDKAITYDNVTIRCKDTLNAYVTSGDNVLRPSSINWVTVA